MNTVYVTLIAIVYIFISCDKNIDDIDEFNFKITENHRAEALINVEENTILNVFPEKEAEAQKFEFKYIVNAGNGFYNNVEGNTIPQDTYRPVKDLRFNLLFVGIEEGEADVSIFIRDRGIERKIDLIYNIVKIARSFNYTATRELATAIVGQGVTINFNGTETGGGLADSYTMIFETTSNGVLRVKGIDYSPGETIPLSSLNFKGTYFALTDKNHKITTTITAASNNRSVPKSITIDFEPSSFNLEVTANTELTVGDITSIDFLINEITANSTFDISYSVSSGPVQNIKNQQKKAIDSNAKFDVEDKSFSWEIEAITPGETKINFIVVNQFGVTQNVIIEFTIQPLRFNFSVTPLTTSPRIKERSVYRINTSQLPSTLTYQLKIDTGSDIKLNYVGLPVNSNAFFAFNPSDPIIQIISDSPGENIFNFIIKASNGEELPKNVRVNYDAPPILISARINNTTSVTPFSAISTTTIIIAFDKDPNVGIEAIILNGTRIVLNLPNTENEINITRNGLRRPFDVRERQNYTLQLEDSNNRLSRVFNGAVVSATIPVFN